MIPGVSVGRLELLQAAELQDHLLMAVNDLERLQRLLDGACDALLVTFSRVNSQLETLKVQQDVAEIEQAHKELANAITGLQFQDMATQLIAHTTRRLRSCSDRLAQAAMGEDEDGQAVVEAPPNRPNPVTQDEMDAGSVELF